jgi:hypothetical protein
VSAAAEKALIAAVMLVATLSLFVATGALVDAHAPVSWLATRWDPAIPLVPAAVWPYASWYLAPWLLLAAPRRAFRRVAGATALAFAVCTAGFVLVPAVMERPEIAGGGASAHALRFLYRHDLPWNIFPSFHAALCAILWRPAFGGAWARRLMPWWMASICLACVLTRQHQILDVIVGFVVGAAALAMATAAQQRLERRYQEQASARQVSPWHALASRHTPAQPGAESAEPGSLPPVHSTRFR